MNVDREIANIIKAQLGGREFEVMTGAHSFGVGERGLYFKLPNRCYFTITLRNDLYDLEYFKSGHFRNGTWVEPKLINSSDEIFVEHLCETFTEMTGLYTSL